MAFALRAFAIVVGATISAACTDPRGEPSATAAATRASPDEPASAATLDLARAVLGDTEDVWGDIFRRAGGATYPQPKLVLFSGSVDTSCGRLRNVVPTYCPSDRSIYADKNVLASLGEKNGTSGDLVQSYLVARAVGQHVQNITGQAVTVPGASRASASSDPRTELQADCYAGVWMHFVQQRGGLDVDDLTHGVQGALSASAQVAGVDDERRREWFGIGLANGDPRRCDARRAAR